MKKLIIVLLAIALTACSAGKIETPPTAFPTGVPVDLPVDNMSADTGVRPNLGGDCFADKKTGDTYKTGDDYCDPHTYGFVATVTEFVKHVAKEVVATLTPEPTQEVTNTPNPTQETTATPDPTLIPTDEPTATIVPSHTPEPTTVPTDTPTEDACKNKNASHEAPAGDCNAGKGQESHATQTTTP